MQLWIGEKYLKRTASDGPEQHQEIDFHCTIFEGNDRFMIR